jgi:hypothetical protein
MCMNRYETAMPRAALGAAAVLLTAITIGVSVVMPAETAPNSREPRALAAITVTAPATKGAVAGAASSDLVAVHEPGSSSQPKRVPEG